ncbi:hypothetical protein SAMN04488105_10364 [Salipiger thiooxidans]|uniref:Uncharacterized protein n=1 Tax=Salipiger thiooxidans TaxID=282683 RepID=A0A1G7CCE0_9RHOB|nr:hypothetical protein [Salipiger thiooxidans]SDE36979.1 hypothetical protein SAMN04488105_10364 [Salipiger thiooxidans]
MTRDGVLLFTPCFLAGSLISAPDLQLRHSLTLTLVVALALVVAAARVLARLTRGHEAWLASLLALWQACVLTVAVVTAARRDRRIAPQARRFATLAGLPATPLPWFGRATARTMLT